MDISSSREAEGKGLLPLDRFLMNTLGAPGEQNWGNWAGQFNLI